VNGNKRLTKISQRFDGGQGCCRLLPVILYLQTTYLKMDTTIKTFQAQASAQTNYGTNKVGLVQRYNNWIESIKFNHFFIMSFAILFGSCLGSISAMFVFYAGAPIWVFSIGLFASMANLVAAISQAPTKYVVTTFIISVLVNVTLLLVFPMV
jgi:hypothetical protein